jgi:hypothetical protein
VRRPVLSSKLLPGEVEPFNFAPEANSITRAAFLGLSIQQSQGAKFYLVVMNELKNRGLQDDIIQRLISISDVYLWMFVKSKASVVLIHKF